MNERKNLFKFILFLMIFLICFAGICFLGCKYLSALKRVYDESFYAGLKTKYDRLTSVKGPKIVVIGGSSVAFGIDSKIVERETGIPCVNFGLYAAIGFKPMLDLSKKSIGEGDIVVLAPELSSQMYSGYIGYEYLTDSVEGRPDLATALGKEYAKGFLSALPKYLSRRNRILKSGISVDGVYANSSFDEYGDIVYLRNENVMNGGYNKTDLPEISTDILTEEFFDMVNTYAEYCKERGASVYLGFPPMNALSVKDTDEAQEAFLNKLKEDLDFEILASLEDHIMDPGYFYDSNFHTNDPGTVYNTLLLVNDIKRVTGNMTLTSIEIPEPLAGEEEEDTDKEIQNDGIFNFILTDKGIVVKGLTEEGKALTELNVPTVLGGYNVWDIDSFAFEDSKAIKLTLPDGIGIIREGILKNADSIKNVYIYCKNLPEVSSDMLYMAPEDVVLYVEKDVYGKYVTDYFWGLFSHKLKPMDE
jgi:hypothetical protein